MLDNELPTIQARIAKRLKLKPPRPMLVREGASFWGSVKAKDLIREKPEDFGGVFIPYGPPALIEGISAWCWLFALGLLTGVVAAVLWLNA